MLNKSIDQWLAEYGESHQHPTNKLIHWVCVPVILWCVLALLWLIPLGFAGWINGATLLLGLSIVFYARLSWTLALGMTAIGAISVALIIGYMQSEPLMPLWLFAVLLFVVAWIGQFIGHHIEGKKPSFFQDLQFLLIGPAWLLSFIYQKIGIPLRG